MGVGEQRAGGEVLGGWKGRWEGLVILRRTGKDTRRGDAVPWAVEASNL